MFNQKYTRLSNGTKLEIDQEKIVILCDSTQGECYFDERSAKELRDLLNKFFPEKGNNYEN